MPKLYITKIHWLYSLVGVRAWNFLTPGHAVREVGGLNPGCCTTVGGVFHPVRQLARFPLSNMPSNVNIIIIS